MQLFVATAAILGALLLPVANASGSNREIQAGSLGFQSVSPQTRESGDHFSPWRGVGGTQYWKQLPARHGLKLDAEIQYAPNSLGHHHITGGFKDATPLLGGQSEWPMIPKGVTPDWEGLAIFGGEPFSMTFDSANLQFVIAGTALDVNTDYQLYFYTTDCQYGCGGSPWTLVSQTDMGMPVNGEVTAPSPFENGYIAQTSTDYTLFLVAHPTDNRQRGL